MLQEKNYYLKRFSREECLAEAEGRKEEGQEVRKAEK